MGWVTWRRHRSRWRRGARGARPRWPYTCGSPAFRCTTPGPPSPPAGGQAPSACGAVTNDFNSGYVSHAVAAIIMVQVVPALIGAFAWAPVLARELETGTFRYGLDTGHRPVALDPRQAGAARYRAGRCRRGFQRAVLLVLPAVLRRELSDPVRSSVVRSTRGRICRAGRWSPHRSVSWPAC